MKILKSNRKLLSRIVSLILLAILVCPQIAPYTVNAETNTAEQTQTDQRSSGQEVLGIMPAEEDKPAVEKGAESEGGAVMPGVTEGTAAKISGLDKSNLLGSLIVDVEQDGKVVPAGEKLNSKNPIRIHVTFPFPVKGDIDVDSGDPSTYIQGGDYAYIDFPTLLTLIPLPAGKIELKFGDTVIGELRVVEEGGVKKARVDFKSAVNEPTINSANGKFTIDMTYDKENNGDDDQIEQIGIFGKTFYIVLPPKKITVTAEKSSTPNTSDKKILWKIKVNADKEGGDSITDGKLNRVSFTDNLEGVGEYTANSFKVGTTDAYADAKLITPGYEGKKLTFTFPENDPDGQPYIGTRYIFFETEIPDDKYYTNQEQTIQNTAEIKDKTGAVVSSPKGTAKYKMEWIKKEGAQVGDGMSGGIYDPSNREITWTVFIEGNLSNAVFTDELPGGLVYESAVLGLYNDDIGDYNPAVSIGADMVVNGRKLSYSMGDISGKRKITITSRLENPGDTAAKEITFWNTAKVTSDEISEIKSNAASVKIGVAAIRKSAEAYDRKTHVVDWKVSLDTKGQALGGNLRTLDLIVYDSEFNVNTLDNYTFGLDPLSLTYVSEANLRALKPSYNQRLKADSFTGTGMKATVYPVEAAGKRIADLLVVTSDMGGPIDATAEKTYSYSTTVCNPNYYAGNGTKRVENSASLFSKDILLNTNTAYRDVQSDMLGKDVLTRNEASTIKNTADVGSAEVLGAANSAPANNEAGFDYIDKSVIYRIYVNANGIADVTNDVTAVEGETLGNYKVQDVLPKGWKFQKINGSEDFLLYEGTGNGSKVTASALVPKEEAETLINITGPAEAGDNKSGESMSFDFRALNKSYVILVKAGPDTDTAKDYFSHMGETTVSNKVNVIDNSNITSDVKASVDTKIKSEVLRKTIEEKVEDQEYLRWQVDYRPYGITYPDAYMEDKLPLGLDLRLDSKGALVIEDEYGINLSICELMLKSDGTCVEGEELTLPDKDVLSYDNETRKLKFMPPDSSKSYRIRYLTDITGEGGLTINNEVVLNIGSEVTSDIGQDYTISNMSYGALLQRSGWFEIEKTDGETGIFVKDAKFVLCSLDGVVIREGITNAAGELYMKALPMGDFILKEAEAPGGYAKTDKVFKIHVEKDGDGIPKTSIDGDVEAKLAIQNFKEGSVGNISISKTVAGSGGDVDKEFEFTVQLKDGAGNALPDSYTYLKQDKDKKLLEKGSLTSGQTVKLSHTQSMTILDIPKETAYEISEKDYTAGGYITTISGDTKGKVTADTVKQIHFTNTRSVGELTISKSVVGNGADKDRAFEFKLEFDALGSYPYVGLGGASNGTVKSGDTIKLKDGQSISISNLPQNTKYSVIEEDYSKEGYTMAKTGDTGVIIENKTSSASFFNTRNTGKLEIAKSVKGDGGDKTRKFKFTVGFDGKDADAAFQYKGNGVPDGQIKSGDKIDLAHGQSIVIEGILEGTSYKIEEQDYTSEGYTVTVSGEKGSISGDNVSKVHFVNTKSMPSDQLGGNDQTGNNAKTGDNTSILLYCVLFILAGVGVVSVVYMKRRKNKSGK